jgi:hypothetical protein
VSGAISVLTDRKSLLSEDSLLERVIAAALQYYGATGCEFQSVRSSNETRASNNAKSKKLTYLDSGVLT